jgi:hypothetical protein
MQNAIFYIYGMRKLTTLLLFCVLPLYAEFAISDGDRFANLKLFAKDSLQVGKFHKNSDYRVQNSITVGLFLNGLATPNISFDAFAELNTDRAFGLTYQVPNDFQPYLGYPYAHLDQQLDNNKGRTWDFFRARTDWQATSYLKISTGYDYLSYGPARRNKLALRGSDFYWRAIQDTADYAYIKRPVPTPFIGWDLSLASVSYSQYAAQLKSWREYEKYLHAHRLNFKVHDNFSFGLSEIAVYGSRPYEHRDIEPTYLLPFMPYLFAKTYGEDRDNNGISADFSWKLFNKIEIYNEWFMDDLDRNKWAASLGIAIDFAKIGMFNWDYNFEYTRIEPWVYTHNKGLSTDYTHFGNSLGSDLGSNSREFYSRLGISFKELLRLDLSASGIEKDALHYQEYGAAILYKPFSIWNIGAKQYLIFGEYKGKRTEVFSGIIW